MENSETNITVQLPLNVTDQLCKDLLTTCVEGGSSYWLAAERVERDADLNVVKIIGCFDAGDEDTKWGDADLQTMREGLRLLLSGEVKVNAVTRQNLLAAAVDPEDCQWDADDADCVLQAGLLKDIVYG